MIAIEWVVWVMKDGFVNDYHQQFIDVDPNDFIGLSPEEIACKIKTMVQNDFEDQVDWECDITRSVDLILSEIKGDE